MHLDRIFTICPYLLGSPEGVLCRVSANFIRNMEDVHPDICISRHFEVCHLYRSKLEEMTAIPSSTPDVTFKQI
jgi:hypothetical protein